MKTFARAIATALLSCLGLTALSVADDTSKLPRQSQPEPVVTTIRAVNADPLRFHKKIIRIRGVVNECVSYTCNICEVAYQESRDSLADCMSIEFWPGPSPENQTDDERRARDAARALLENVYRFAEITSEGPYDGRCALHYDPEELSLPPGERNEIVCMHRSDEFVAETIRDVHKQSPASTGLFESYEGDPLAELPSDQTKDLIVRYEAMLAQWDLIDATEKKRTTTYRAFRSSSFPDEAVTLCECLETNCETRWPTMSGHIWTKSPANPYQCHWTKMIDRKWSFFPD